MGTKAAEDRDVIGTIGRCINTVRDFLLTALIVFGAFILWHLWPEMEQQLKTGQIKSVSFAGALSFELGAAVTSFQSNNLTINAVGGPAEILEKGSLADLARAEIQRAGRVDLVGISADHQYSGDILLAYISRLAPKFVIFRNSDALDAWIDAGLFAAQLRPNDNYSYATLVITIHGLRRESISDRATARDALDKMQELHLDHLPAVDDTHRFKFMLSRNDILAKVISSVVLSPQK
jgi:hypothetical protein